MRKKSPVKVKRILDLILTCQLMALFIFVAIYAYRGTCLFYWSCLKHFSHKKKL